MKPFHLTFAAVMLTATGLVAAAPANAQSRSTSLTVSAIVLENCTITATPMVFGTLSNVGGSNIDSTSTISLVCTPNADFEVAMDNGTYASGGQRRMKNALSEDYLPYQIYLDSARSQAWGSNAGVNTKSGVALLGTAAYTAYGRIASGTPQVSAGAYADTVTVTVNF